MKIKKIRWDKQAINYFSKSILHIRKDSPQNADKIKKELLQKIRGLLQHPEAYPPDKYKQNNNGNYRAFELYRFRISYLIKENEIIIARMRHTSQEPKAY